MHGSQNFRQGWGWGAGGPDNKKVLTTLCLSSHFLQFTEGNNNILQRNYMISKGEGASFQRGAGSKDFVLRIQLLIFKETYS